MTFTIVIDSREQKPYAFEGAVTRGLKAGDYSLEGYENAIAIERKTKNDAYGTIGQGRARFTRELKRLSQYQYAAIVLESSLSAFLRPPSRSQLSPKSAINSLLAWSIRYGVHIFFADNRLLAQSLTYRLLEKFWKEKQK